MPAAPDSADAAAAAADAEQATAVGDDAEGGAEGAAAVYAGLAQHMVPCCWPVWGVVLRTELLYYQRRGDKRPVTSPASQLPRVMATRERSTSGRRVLLLRRGEGNRPSSFAHTHAHTKRV